MSESQRWYLFDNMMNSERSLEKNKNQSPIHGMPDRLCSIVKTFIWSSYPGALYIEYSPLFVLTSINTVNLLVKIHNILL